MNHLVRMPGDTTVNFNLLHRTCKLVVLLCFLHISVTVVFYVRSLDLRFAFVQNQQSHNNPTQLNQPRNPGFTSRAEPKDTETSKGAAVDFQVEEQKDEPKLPDNPPEKEKVEEPVKKLEKCPETSPLLGKAGLISCL